MKKIKIVHINPDCKDSRLCKPHNEYEKVKYYDKIPSEEKRITDWLLTARK